MVEDNIICGFFRMPRPLKLSNRISSWRFHLIFCEEISGSCPKAMLSGNHRGRVWASGGHGPHGKTEIGRKEGPRPLLTLPSFQSPDSLGSYSPEDSELQVGPTDKRFNPLGEIKTREPIEFHSNSSWANRKIDHYKTLNKKYKKDSFFFYMDDQSYIGLIFVPSIRLSIQIIIIINIKKRLRERDWVHEFIQINLSLLLWLETEALFLPSLFCKWLGRQCLFSLL